MQEETTRQTPTTISIGLDIGYNTTKVVGTQIEAAVFEQDKSERIYQTTFRSLISPPLEERNALSPDTYPALQFVQTNAIYAIGDNVSRFVSHARRPATMQVNGWDDQELLGIAGLTAWAKHLPIAVTTARVNTLCVGLPMDVIADPIARQQVKELFAKDRTLLVGGRSIKLRIDTVLVIPQPAGAYWILTAEHPKLLDAPGAIVIDIGGGTTDVLYVAAGKLSAQHSFALRYGVNTIYREAARLLAAKGIIINAQGLEQHQLSGTLEKLAIDPKSGVAFIWDAYREAAQPLIAEMKEFLTPMLFTESVIVGGGSILLGSIVAQALGLQPLTTARNPVTLNAEGFYRHATNHKRPAK